MVALVAKTFQLSGATNPPSKGRRGAQRDLKIRQALLLMLTSLAAYVTMLSQLPYNTESDSLIFSSPLLFNPGYNAPILISPLPVHAEEVYTRQSIIDRSLPFANDSNAEINTLQPVNDHSITFANGQIRGAAVMLVTKPWTARRGDERQCYFNMSLDSLSSNWYPTNRYPLILQQPEGWTEQEMDDIRQQWPQLEIYFSDVGSAFNVTPPPSMEDDQKPLGTLGYKRMCAYKTYGFLRAPYMSNLDYMFYIDDDACITEPIRYDVFQKMQQNHVAYTYKQIFLDPDFVVQGLEKFVKDYKRRHNLQPANPSLAAAMRGNYEGSLWAFSTNIEWMNLNEFRRADVSAFHAAVEESDMIFHRRWGDAPLRFVLPYLFFNNTQVMHLCSKYIHSLWPASVSTCTDDFQTPTIQDAVFNHLPECTTPWCN